MWSSEPKILEIPFDKKLAFKTEIKILLKKDARKLGFYQDY